MDSTRAIVSSTVKGALNQRHMMSETAEENRGWSSDIPWVVLYSSVVLLLMLAWASSA
jgi:hypothetical protein